MNKLVLFILLMMVFSKLLSFDEDIFREKYESFMNIEHEWSDGVVKRSMWLDFLSLSGDIRGKYKEKLNTKKNNIFIMKPDSDSLLLVFSGYTKNLMSKISSVNKAVILTDTLKVTYSNSRIHKYNYGVIIITGLQNQLFHGYIYNPGLGIYYGSFSIKQDSFVLEEGTILSTSPYSTLDYQFSRGKLIKSLAHVSLDDYMVEGNIPFGSESPILSNNCSRLQYTVYGFSSKEWVPMLSKGNIYSPIESDGSYYLYNNKEVTFVSGKKIKIWEKRINADRTSAITQNIYDLKNKKYKCLTLVTYDSNGRVIDSYDHPESSSWSSVIPGTVGSSIVDFIQQEFKKKLIP